MALLQRSPPSFRLFSRLPSSRPYHATPSRAAKLTIGIRREDPTRIWERRCPLTPDAVSELVEQDGVDVLVQDCDRRVFSMDEFIKAGARPHPTLSPAHITVGIKETPVHEILTSSLPAPYHDSSNSPLIPRTHFMFSHTVKGQLYNMELLSKFLSAPVAAGSTLPKESEMLPRLIDYELLTGDDGKRTVGFGWFAGVAGALEAFCALAHAHLELGVASPFLRTPRPQTQPSLSSIRGTLRDVVGMRIASEGTPKVLGPLVIGVTGTGKVSQGVLAILEDLPIQKVRAEDLPALISDPDTDLHKIYVVHALPNDYFVRLDGRPYERSDYYANPQEYRSEFHTKGGLEFLPRHSTLSVPFFSTRPPILPQHLPSVTMMAVDILPSALPLEASQHFSRVLLPYLRTLMTEYHANGNGQLPAQSVEEKGRSDALKRATIAQGGKLTDSFIWLEGPLGVWQEGKAATGSPMQGKISGEKEDAQHTNAARSKKVAGLRPKKKVLILGSGMVAGPAIAEICKRTDVQLIVGNNSFSEAERLTSPYSNATPAIVDMDDLAATNRLVAESDIVISLLPVPYHPTVADVCIRHGKHLVTASYISPAMRDLHERAVAADVLLLNEIGLDPGIDHCSALSLIASLRAQNKEIVSFTSFCGGLPAPEYAEDIPLGYKFSWSPKGVLSAASNSAEFKLWGEECEIDGSNILQRSFADVPVSDVLKFEGIANRNSLPYAGIYGLGPLSNLRSILRGTLRYPGFCDLMHMFKTIGLLESAVTVNPLIGMLFAGTVEDTSYSSLPPLPSRPTAPIDLFATLLAHKLRYEPSERDLVVLSHEIVTRPKVANAPLTSFTTEEEVHTSSLITYGTASASAMSRCVGLPVAFAALQVLDGRVIARGVQGPTDKNVYEHILDSLETVGLVERSVRPQHLAVHLTLVSTNRKTFPEDTRRKSEAYVGWTGMASASSLAHFNAGDSGDRGLETIEMDPQFAEGLGFSLGDVVEIGLLHDLKFAKSVGTEPVTSDDWEILELHASHVESTLLSQVRVATVGQEIDVWVLGRTRVRLKVVSLEPSSSGKALLLTTSTEVSISPKLRRQAESSNTRVVPPASKTNGVNGLGTSQHDASETQPKRSRTLRVLPRHLFAPISPAQGVGSDLTIAYVSRRTLASLAEQSFTSRSIKSWRTSVRHLTSPSSPEKEQATASPSQPASKVLIPGGDTNALKMASTPSSKNEILLLWSPELPIPEGHIMLHGAVDGIEDWDIIRVALVEEKHSYSITEESLAMDRYKQTASKFVHGLAGVNDVLAQCTRFCLTSFAHHAFSKRIRGVPGLLLTGRSGAGKTSLLHAISKSMQEDHRTLAYVLYVDLSRYSGSPIAKVKPLLKYWMDKAAWHRPTVLVLDNIDKLMGAELEHADSFHARHITELFLGIFGCSARSAAPNASGIVLLAAAESQASLHPLLNSSHVFQEIVNLKPPGKDARKDVLSQLVHEHMNSSDIIQDNSAPLNFTALATQTEGYSVTDLKDFVARAVHRAAIRSSRIDVYEDSLCDATYKTTLTPDDFTAAQVDFVPHSLRDVKLQKSEVAWSDIGGLRETKRILRETLEWPTKYGPIFAQSPLRLRSGLLLYGYPGCGKTLLASAVAKECGLNFISIKGPELLNKYIGASEKSVRDLFERASAAKPCVLFFDEFDSIAPKRGHDSTGVTDRVVNQMLTQMDGAEGLEGVYVLAATSLNLRISQILDALSQKVTIAPSVSLENLAHDTEGFSGADLQALVYNAHLEVVHDTISSTASHISVPTRNGVTASFDHNTTDSVEYTVLGVSEQKKMVVSKAEESVFQQRVGSVRIVLFDPAHTQHLAAADHI
ncbi:Peroxisome biosynthesis protein PAS1 [Grifola frondosa]|uniref:Peroxisomal ATPase PEX1 n=1 Tax=Grifola frondosa TaxID=5627 RepID=A0A1C7M7V6_GRIFR|nr:Peroxisome biosynthesis protein PAS1 [Grifola frondosa]